MLRRRGCLVISWDRHIRVKVTIHALRCIDKGEGNDEYLLKTPYNKMDTEMGLFWKAKVEKMYEELGRTDVVFFSPEDEAQIEQGFKDLKLTERESRKQMRKQIYSELAKQKQSDEGRSYVSYIIATSDMTPGKQVVNY